MSAAAADLPPELYEAIGRFVSGYVEVEVQVQLMFINYCGVEFLTGRALVGEQGTHDVLDRTKRVIRARNLDKRILDDVESIHAEISKLTELRNKVVHRTLRGTATAPVLVNHVRARDLAALTVEPLAVEGLKQGTTQAERVCDRVRKHILTEAQVLELKTPEQKAYWGAPWHGTPLQPITASAGTSGQKQQSKKLKKGP